MCRAAMINRQSGKVHTTTRAAWLGVDTGTGLFQKSLSIHRPEEDGRQVCGAAVSIEEAHSRKAHALRKVGGIRHEHHGASVALPSPTMKFAGNQGEA